MPVSCCARNCKNRFRKGTGIKFFNFPNPHLYPDQRSAWIIAVNRINPATKQLWIPSDYDRLCSEHFVTGMYSREKCDLNYKPTLFMDQKAPYNRNSGFESGERQDTNRGFIHSRDMSFSHDTSYIQSGKMNKRKTQLPYFVDRKLVPRVNEFFSSHCRDKSGGKPNLEDAIDYLQYTYPEYGRKKRNSLRYSVQKIFKSRKGEPDEIRLLDFEKRHLQKRKRENGGVLSRSDLEDPGFTQSSDESDLSLDDGERFMEIQDTNFINNSMHEMYSRISRGPGNNESPRPTPPRPPTSQAVSEPPLHRHQPPQPVPELSLHRSFTPPPQLTPMKIVPLPSEPLASTPFSSSLPLPVSVQSIVTPIEMLIQVGARAAANHEAESSLGNKSGSEQEQIISVPSSIEMINSPLIKTEFVAAPASCQLLQNRKSDNEAKSETERKSKNERKSGNKRQYENERKSDNENKSENERRDDNNSQKHSRLNKRKRLRNRQTEVDEAPKFEPTKSELTFNDVGGCEGCLEEVVKLLVHLKHPEIFQQLGIKPPRGFLLHGPPGCGKTLLANAIAGELQLPFFKVAATEVVSGVSGESEQKLRELFSVAVASAPSILFIDEIDSITPKRETASKEMERRIVAQLLSCMDDLAGEDAQVLVIGATNRPDSIDPALRRAGRFDREISMGIPDRAARSRILRVVCRDLRLSAEFDFDYVASLTPGFVGADITALTREAAMCAVNRAFRRYQKETKEALTLMLQRPPENHVQDEKRAQTEERRQISLNSLALLRDELPLQPEELESLSIELGDFKDALETVQPSAKREGFATVPDVTWDDIGALEDIREELSFAILAPVRNYEEFECLGLSSPPGILLAGPPGCGKTLLAKAVANEAGINFISVKGPELLNMYVGESERAVRQVFQRARNSSPCVIFFDEIDALCPVRSNFGDSSSSSRVVNQLLTEMDGLEARKHVFLMGATNRPDIIDKAVLRPGRLDKVLYIGLPNADDRVKILQTLTKNGTKPQLSLDVDLRQIALESRCDRFSGADLAALVREASVQALKEYMKLDSSEKSSHGNITVSKQHFEQALVKVRPSVSEKDHSWYEEMRDKYGCVS